MKKIIILQFQNKLLLLKEVKNNFAGEQAYTSIKSASTFVHAPVQPGPFHRQSLTKRVFKNATRIRSNVGVTQLSAIFGTEKVLSVKQQSKIAVLF